VFKLIRHFSYINKNGKPFSGSYHMETNKYEGYLKGYLADVCKDNHMFTYAWVGDWVAHPESGNPVRFQKAIGTFQDSLHGVGDFTIHYDYMYEIVELLNEQ